VTRVTIVGAGNMGRGIGTRVVAGGHQVEIIDRDPADAQRLAEDLGGSASALDPEVPFGGEVVVFAVYYPGIKEAVRQYADQLAHTAVWRMLVWPGDPQDRASLVLLLLANGIGVVYLAALFVGGGRTPTTASLALSSVTGSSSRERRRCTGPRSSGRRTRPTHVH
jgi:ketopantoate reductase